MHLVLCHVVGLVGLVGLLGLIRLALPILHAPAQSGLN